MSNMRDWLTPEQAADLLGLSLRTVKGHLASGHIPSVKVGNARYITPACLAELERRQGIEQPEVDGWGRKGRRSA